MTAMKCFILPSYYSKQPLPKVNQDLSEQIAIGCGLDQLIALRQRVAIPRAQSLPSDCGFGGRLDLEDLRPS